MAINIFQGGKSTSKGGGSTNSAKRSSRVKNAVEALTAPAVSSDSGNVAVGKAGTLQKVGKVVGEVAGIASKFLPGIGGTIAKGISNIFNDPEWWSEIPGDAVTLNQPLRIIECGTTPDTQSQNRIISKPRFAIAEFVSQNFNGNVIHPTDTMITSYLMPEIRKVVNAVPLQDADDYEDILQANASIYAIWHMLKKCDYLLKHGQTYLANLNDPAFPILQVENASWLQSTIGRLEEHLRSNVRLPHTLCEYLAWRFGRIYKSTESVKSALIMYNPVTMQKSIASFNTILLSLMQVASSTPARQKASADMFNAYIDHDIYVDIPDHTQFQFDRKEFCLRTNCDVISSMPTVDAETPDAVYIDSGLDNPTTYMASTVSTLGWDGSKISWLFPVENCYCYIPLYDGSTYWSVGNTTANNGKSLFYRVIADSAWGFHVVHRTLPGSSNGAAEDLTSMSDKMATATVCKTLDIYNKDIYVAFYRDTSDVQAVMQTALDLTALSMDMGTVANTTLANEHVYAFANLVTVRRKKSMSYKQAETLVAKDAANLVDKLDIAAKR